MRPGNVSRMAASVDAASGTDDVASARELLLRSFQWAGGHADFATAFRSPELLAVVGPALARPVRDAGATAVVGIEARGFIVATLVARALGIGLVLARKPGAVHPNAERELASSLDWRGRTLELAISRDAVQHGDRVLLADDWIETGSQATTVAHLLDRLGAQLAGVTVLVDGTTDHIRAELHVVGLVSAEDLPA